MLVELIQSMLPSGPLKNFTAVMREGNSTQYTLELSHSGGIPTGRTLAPTLFSSIGKRGFKTRLPVFRVRKVCLL